jgi:hypothetical protein
MVANPEVILAAWVGGSTDWMVLHRPVELARVIGQLFAVKRESELLEECPTGAILRWTRGVAMPDLTKIGRCLFALATLCFGVILLLHLISPAIPAGGEPFFVLSRFWAWIFGLTLVATALGMTIEKYTKSSALLLALAFLLRAVIVYVPAVAAAPRKPGTWGDAFELLGICGCALLVHGGSAAKLGRVFYSVELVGFAIQHFQYAQFVAALVPGWIPGHLFWAYFVGVALCASAVSILMGTYVRLAAGLLGLMFFSWVLILHLPRCLASPRTGAEWTSAFNALAMAGGAWVIAGGARAFKMYGKSGS